MPERADSMEIRVIGLPAPQGSKRFLGTRGGKGVMVESSKAVKPWRESVKWAALEALEKYSLSVGRHCSGALIGPVSMEVTFTLPRPRKYSSAKHHGVRPSSKPDLSKLVRSTEDALSDAGAWEDDARVTECLARKVYPGQHADALSVPGAVIRISGAQA